MKIYVNIKQAGSRKNYITKEEVILKSKPLTLRELISVTVTVNVDKFNNNLMKEKLIDYLAKDEIENSAELGKVSFGTKYNDTKQELDKALKAAYLAYEDGLYKVFIGDSEVGDLDESLKMKDGDILTFIKFTMLAGRLW